MNKIDFNNSEPSKIFNILNSPSVHPYFLIELSRLYTDKNFTDFVKFSRHVCENYFKNKFYNMSGPVITAKSQSKYYINSLGSVLGLCFSEVNGIKFFVKKKRC